MTDQPNDAGDDDIVVPDLHDLSADAGAGAGGGLDFGDLLGMVGGFGDQIMAAQEAANQTVVEGHAGGGVVKVSVTGGLVFQSVTIDPEVVDPGDVDMLQDLVLAALHDAMARVNELGQQMNPLAGIDLGNLNLGGIDFGGLNLGELGLGQFMDGDSDDDDEYDEDDEDEDDEDESDGSADEDGGAGGVGSVK